MEVLKKLRHKNRKPQKVKRSTEVLSDKTPFSYIESFNALRTNLSFIASANNAKTFIVTSTIPDEGKTTVAINLAISLAKDNNKVLLVDADLRKPSLQRYLNVKQGFVAGLSDVLANQVSMSSSIYSAEHLGIDIMLAGTRAPNPTELLALETMGRIIKQLEETYDFIIIDTPPVGVVTDAAVVSKYTDGAVFVIRQNYTKHEEVESGINHLKQVGCTIHGAILNDYKVEQDLGADTQTQHYYYYYGE